MISGKCPCCEESWFWGWDEEQYGYYAALCEKCKDIFWIELSRFGVTRTHEDFINDVAIPDGRVEEAELCAKSRRERGVSIQKEVEV